MGHPNKKYSVRLTENQIRIVKDRMELAILNHDPEWLDGEQKREDMIYLAIMNNADKALGGKGDYQRNLFY